MAAEGKAEAAVAGLSLLAGLVGRICRHPPRVTTLPLRWRWLTADPTGAILWPGLAWLSQALVCVREQGVLWEEEETPRSPGPTKGKGLAH